MNVRNKNTISTEMITAVAFFSLSVNTIEYPTRDANMIKQVMIIFLSEGSSLSYLKAATNPYLSLHYS